MDIGKKAVRDYPSPLGNSGGINMARIIARCGAGLINIYKQIKKIPPNTSFITLPVHSNHSNHSKHPTRRHNPVLHRHDSTAISALHNVDITGD